MTDLSLLFKSTLTTNLTLKKHNSSLLNRIKKYQTDLLNLTAILDILELTPSRDYPIIIGNASTRMSVLVLGTLPSPSDSHLIKQKAIFPVGFVAKRKYKMHENCKKKTVDEKIFYLCKVGEVPYIECVCGKRYVDKEWELFKSDVKCTEIENMEDFFGLTYGGIVKMIEEMGDVSVYEGYVRLKDRV